MRNKFVAKNLIIISAYQLLAVVLGLYIPKVFLEYCGTNTYGLISSITNFMGYISVLQVGVGGVINAALYKPLANKDEQQLSIVVSTARRFFRKISYISVGYIVFLVFLFTFYLGKDFSIDLTIPLVIGIGAGTFIQYYFGIINQMVLSADQKAYVDSLTQTVCLILNAAVIVVLVKLKFPVALIKVCSVLVYAIRPIVLNIYVNKHYRIDYKAKGNSSLMKQRWYAMAQAIAYYVHSKADIFLLTIFKSFGDIAVYSVYALITTSLTKIIQIIDTSVQAAFGNVFAKKEDTLLTQRFNQYTTIMHIASSTIFSTAIVAAVSFVKIYTRNVHDYDYNAPWFSFVIILAEMTYCLRMPYAMMISVSGRYKETMAGAIVEAAGNILLSIGGYYVIGLTGIAIGTLFAMVYRTIDYIVFLRKNILHLKIFDVFRRYLITIICVSASCLSTSWLFRSFNVSDFAKWILFALLSAVIVAAINLCVNYIFYRNDIAYAIGACRNLLSKKREVGKK